MLKTLKEMLDRRAAIVAEVETLEKKRASENREFSAEESDLIDKLLEERDQLNPLIETKQKEQSERRNQQVKDLLNGPVRGAGGAPVVRGVEPGDTQRSDPVLNPDPAKYSLLRAIDRRAQGRDVDGYEGEISQEISRRSGKAATGFFVPLSLRMNPDAAEYRDLNTTGGAGAIPNILMTGRFIDALRNRPLLMQLGAQVLSDMIGTFDIPKQTGTATAYWVTEGNSPTESQQTIGQVPFAPSTLGAFTDITRRFLKQTSIDGERFVRNDLVKVISLELDRAGFNGSGDGAIPEGILQNGDVEVVEIGADGGVPDWAKIVELESKIAAANADVATMAYVTSALGRGVLKTKEKGTAGYPVYLWGDNNQMNGYRAAVTNQIPTNLTKGDGEDLTALIFGDFSTVMFALWGGLDILVDPYTHSTSGTLRITALLDATLKILQPEKLAFIGDMVTVMPPAPEPEET